MKKFLLNLSFLTTAFVLMAAITWIGCSKTPTTNDTSTDLSSLGLTAYFPLNGGSHIDFNVINYATGDTTRERYVIGSSNEYSSTQTIFGWISYDVDHPFFVDTGYLCLDDEILYYYDNLYGRPETILSTPFEVGKTWARYSSAKGILDSGTVIDINYGYDYNKYSDGSSGDGSYGPGDYNPYGGYGYDDGWSFKNFPSAGSNVYEIYTVEDISLGNGTSYRNCIKVISKNGDLEYDYWYAPGMGLVKYILAEDPNEYPDGKIVGERVPGWNY